MNGHQTKNLTLEEYAKIAQDCDVGLWRPTSWWGKVIAAGTDGPYSHACSVLWWEGKLFQVAYEEGKGGFASPLKTAVTTMFKSASGTRNFQASV